jgi:hypothetical protein
VSAQPFCDQCDNDSVCAEVVDAQCLIYHLTTSTYTPPASRLINLNLPNGSNSQTIFEAIDAALGAIRPWVPGTTPTLQLETTGVGLPVTLIGNVKISAASGNILVANSDGLFVPGSSAQTGKVKVSAIDPLLYLEDAVVGGTDGCVSLSITRDSGSGLLFFQPTISAQCLFTTLFETIDTTSIHLSLNTSGSPVSLQASSKISASGGNQIVVHSDGLFVPAPGASGLIAANNGLSVAASTTAQLGGPLIQNTTIGFATGSFYLRFNSTPQIVVGEGTPSGGSIVQIDNTYASGFNKTAGLATTTTTNLRASGGGVAAFSDLILTGGTDTDTSVKAGSYGQIFFSGSSVLNSSDAEVAYAGVHGIVVPEGSGTAITGTSIPAGVVGGAFASDNATITSLAALQARAIYQSPGGAAFSGTITNYYGLYVEDNSTGLGSHITNKYAIFQAGSTMLNSFSTAVVVTSDERVKTNFESYTKGLKEIEKIDTKKFHFKDHTTGEKRVGVVAQEIEKIIPEAVSTSNDEYYGIEDFKRLDTDTIIFTLVNAVKELSAQNKVLKERLDAIKQY